MKKQTQKEQIEGMMKRPIPKKKVGIIRLQIVRAGRSLYGMERFTNPKEAVEMVQPLFELSDREIMLVVSLDTKMTPLAAEIAAVGGVDICSVDVRNIFKHSLLNNATYVICFHNHPSRDTTPSFDDKRITKRIAKAGAILGIPLVDHIITGKNEFFSFKEREMPELNYLEGAA